ncbi:MAG: TIGR04190 family B12-binding domain/radical SAM domain protein [Dehalococcoidia bacterium]|nr:TIGR04190 family B12-binding domain/radical SAM domain protein [Dehalococcoidia bacterium]
MSKPELILLHAPSNYDFRQRSIVYGPISDVIPSTPIFEMYPIGFTSIAGYLEKSGIRTRIVNIANRMLTESGFDVERFLSRLHPVAFGIDLHWLPHAQGSLELAKVVKRLHPSIPVIFGGLSSTFFYEELIGYPQVDFVVRGDSTEEPMLRLMRRIKSNGPFDDIPNVSWKDRSGTPHHNALSWVLSDLNSIPLDYGYAVRSVIRYRSLSGMLPFNNWLDYPITAVFTCRGCTLNCHSCGGSRYAFKNMCGRDELACRSPQLLADDIHSIQRYLRGPVFIIGDIRQPGNGYDDELLHAMSRRGVNGPVVLELFSPAGEDFFKKVSRVIPHYNIQMSTESHDEEVRRAFGKGWRNVDVEETIRAAVANNCRRFDLFYMIGLPKQDRRSVTGTVEYMSGLLREYGKGKVVHPHISPLAPFIDPGSQVFDRPEEFGYRLFYRTLEQHRQALVSPAWSHMLSYETQWMSRQDIVDATYEAAIGFNQAKARFGVIRPDEASQVEARIRKDMELIAALDRRIATRGDAVLVPDEQELALAATCLKKELQWPAKSFIRNMPRIIWSLCRP